MRMAARAAPGYSASVPGKHATHANPTEATAMKKFAPLLLLFLFAVLAWEAVAGASGMSVHIDGEQLDGPLGVLFAGGGLLVATLAILCVGVLLAVLFAGLGMLAVGAVVLVLLLVGLLASPLLLPLALVLGLLYYLGRDGRAQRRQRAHSTPQDPLKP